MQSRKIRNHYPILCWERAWELEKTLELLTWFYTLTSLRCIYLLTSPKKENGLDTGISTHAWHWNTSRSNVMSHLGKSYSDITLTLESILSRSRSATENPSIASISLVHKTIKLARCPTSLLLLTHPLRELNRARLLACLQRGSFKDMVFRDVLRRVDVENLRLYYTNCALVIWQNATMI